MSVQPVTRLVTAQLSLKLWFYRNPNLAQVLKTGQDLVKRTITCEVEIDCKINTLQDKQTNCPEALFEWKRIQVKQKDFVRRSSSTLPLDLISNLPNSDKELFKPKITAQKSSAITYTTDQLPNKRLYKSELSMPKSFAENNVGRWSCNSAFGIGAVLEQEPAKLMLTPPTMLSAELREVVNGEEGWRRSEAAAKLTWKQPKMPALSGNSVQKRRKTEDLFKIEGYVIEFRTAEDRNWKAVTGNSVSHVEGNVFGSYQVEQLQPNKKYQFRIRTKSANKEGYLSVPSAASAWLETPQSPPKETINELRSRILDDYHLFLEWDPIEIDHPTGPNLRYNQSTSRQFQQFETVEDPSLVLNIATVSSVNEDSLENRDCQTLAVSVRPFNDLGSGQLAADTVIQLTRDGPRRQAQNIDLTPINSTHLKISWSWLNEGDCENVIGAQISCDEITPRVTNKPQPNSKRRDLTGVESSKEWSAVNQSVPAHYTEWLIHGLNSLTEYRCRIRAFDQHGRWGPASAEPAPQAKTLEPAPTEAPQIIYIRLIRDSASNSLATLIDWKSVALGPIDSPINLGWNLKSNKSSLMDRGYKVFIYPETGANPTTLNLYEYELTPGQNPSARIDG
uniref:Fibronectin type-III domain-containing protein n=1 Tax=Ditylenchus dipsaci TaxID=166011 RepID=A0A915DVF9_9BILA